MAEFPYSEAENNEVMLESPIKPTFNAYIDGFNLYKGALERRPDLKWLDIAKFCQSQVPSAQLGQIYYFTAPVKERYSGDDAPRRQQTYLRVLSAQGIQVVRGKFRKDNKWLRVVSPTREGLLDPSLPKHFGLTDLAIAKAAQESLPDLPKAQVFDMEEKGSDVSLASYLLRDALRNDLQKALIITGDSDLATPIQFATEAGCETIVLVPGVAQSVVELTKAATSLYRIHTNWLVDAQLPKTFKTAQGRHIHRPSDWG